MVKLRLKGNNVFVVEGSKKDNILQGGHRIFFTALADHQLDEANYCYLFSDRIQMLDIIKETVGYLKEEGIKFSTDNSILKILERLESEQQDYERAKQDTLKSRHLEQIHVPDFKLVRKLRPHQQKGAEHLLLVKNGANFSVPGSGKTTVIYSAFEYMRRNNVLEKLLVIGPRSCFLPWEEEAINCFGSPLRSVRLTGTKIGRHSAYLQSEEYDLFLCTYQTAANDIEEIISLCQRHKLFIVIDESHNIKKIERGVWSEAVINVAPYAERRAILSGTPMPNEYSDLWTQITFLWPGEQILGNRDQFQYRCKEKVEIEHIRQSLRPIIFRTKKSELNLPPIKFKIHKCNMKPYQASIYRALAIRFLREIEMQPEERQVLRQWRRARLVRLIQTASNPTLLMRYSEEFDINPLDVDRASILQLIEKYPKYEIPIKFELANKLVRELLANGEKIVLWTTFVHNIRMLKKLLRDINPFIVFGAVPRDESENIEFNREQQIREFKETSGTALLIANPAACAESISLHKACHHAVYLDRTFNCGQYMQSLDRLHRIGLKQDEIINYHILITKQTIDETINQRLIEKQETMLSLLEDDLPLGTFEVEEHEMEPIEQEEMIDFEETIKDIRKHWVSDLQ